MIVGWEFASKDKYKEESKPKTLQLTGGFSVWELGYFLDKVLLFILGSFRRGGGWVNCCLNLVKLRSL